jgi:hypothetical protein|uniref:Uncharacterized protein n=1 Tax=Myoviridae sp. ctsIb3 TaxID=2825189 RepID=A0A8S5URI7_9CAUD|nr:MAG TPA: hypothetical protein [Myoviridae sp. ctsIb3]
MANPLMQFLGGTSGPSMPSPMGNVMQLLRQFQQFRSAFQGDPQKQVEELRKSGKMSDEQYHQLEAMAKQIIPFIK